MNIPAPLLVVFVRPPPPLLLLNWLPALSCGVAVPEPTGRDVVVPKADGIGGVVRRTDCVPTDVRTRPEVVALGSLLVDVEGGGDVAVDDAATGGLNFEMTIRLSLLGRVTLARL